MASLLLLSLLSSFALAGEHVLAVVPFDSATANTDLAPVAEGMATMMVTDLGEASEVTMVERQRIDELIEELDFQQSAYADPKTAQKIGRILGASAMVTGQLSEASGTVRIDARVVDVASGEILVAAENQGDIDDVFSVERVVALGILDGLGVQMSASHRARLEGGGGQRSRAPRKRIEPGSGFDDAGYSLSVWKKGLMWPGHLWVDGVDVGKVKNKAGVTVSLKPGRHEVVVTDGKANGLDCGGILDVTQDLEMSTADICKTVSFGDWMDWGQYGSLRRGGVLAVNVEGKDIHVQMDGPTSFFTNQEYRNVEPGSYAISAEHRQQLDVEERPDPHTTQKVTPLCNIVVIVEPDRVTRVNVGMGGCGGA